LDGAQGPLTPGQQEWLDYVLAASRAEMANVSTGEQFQPENAVEGEVDQEFIPFGAYPKNGYARAAYYAGRGPEREDPLGRRRRQYVACSRCHAMNNWGRGTDPGDTPFLDAYGWVNPEYIDQEARIRTITNQGLTLVAGALFIEQAYAAMPAGAAAAARPPAPNSAASRGIGAAAARGDALLARQKQLLPGRTTLAPNSTAAPPAASPRAPRLRPNPVTSRPRPAPRFKPDPNNNVTAKARTTDQFLDDAEKFLGPAYRQGSDGAYYSADGMRRVRFTDTDLTGAHGRIGPHGHFEFNGGRNIHIPLK